MQPKKLIAMETDFLQHNGIRIVEATPDHTQVDAQITEQSQNIYGIVHGGLYFTMMDSAAGVTARLDGRRYVTLDSTTHFYKSASHGSLHATAKVIRRGRTVCVVGAEVHGDSGELLADGSFSMFCIGEEPSDTVQSSLGSTAKE